MIKSKNILFSLIIIGVVSFINPDLHSPMVLPDFAFTVEVKDVHCTSDGELLFQVSNSDTSATITYTVFLKPELEKPYKVQNANTLRNLNAGEYRIVATQELDGLSSSQEMDVTINDLYEPLEFSVFVEDNCQGDDGKIMVEM